LLPHSCFVVQRAPKAPAAQEGATPATLSIIPSTAQEAYSPIWEGFTTPIDPRDELRGPAPYVDKREAALKAARQGEAPFFRDTEIKLNNRSYWFAEDSFGLDKPEALTSGGYLFYQSERLSRGLAPH
jgi:hypothetical protein